MDEVLARKLLRQVRLLNILIIGATLIFITMFAIGGFFGYMAYQEAKDAQRSLTNIQTDLGSIDIQSTDDLQKQLCSSEGTLGALLKNQSDICE